VGTTLREERLRRRFSLEHVSNVTRIAARYLEAIEDNRPGDLPGVVFTRGFVQQYARFLELPETALLAQLPRVDVENAALPAPPTKAPKPFWTPKLKRTVTLAGAATATLAIATAAWVGFSLSTRAIDASRWALSSASVALGRAADRLSVKAAANEKLAEPGSTPRPAAVAGTPPVATERPVTEPPQAEEAAAAEALHESPIQVLLTARANAWVQVTADGKAAFSGLLRANDSKAISGNQLVKVMTGNAGGLEISLNGKALDPLGPEGQVRTVKLTAEGLLPDPKTQPRALDPL
jgi:cytoskeletal protein RodZ